MADAQENSAIKSDSGDGGVLLPSGNTNTSHPDAAEILRKFEDFFSDEELPGDAHLLAKTGGDGNGIVSISSILYDKRLRFKPLSAVRDVLKQSTVLEVVGAKHIKRKSPLTVGLRVEPKLAYNAEKWKPSADQPWLTKGMMKPTGFEEDAVDDSLTAAEVQENQGLYDPDKSLPDRVETAIALFRRKRKFHQQQAHVFEKLMNLGGIDGGPRAFGGRMSKEELEGLNKEELAMRTSQHKVSEVVVNGLEGSSDNPTWTVDFEGVAKCFLSTTFLELFNWTSSEQVKIAASVLRTFYRYLMLHRVCPEYHTQLEAACKVCDLAEDELPKLWKASTMLPGDFNKACSQQSKGVHAEIYSSGTNEWDTGDEKNGWNEKDAMVIIVATISAYGTDEQLTWIEAVAAQDVELIAQASEVVGLEVMGVELPGPDAQCIFDAAAATNTCIKPVGKLHARRWELPYSAPTDLPTSITEKKAEIDFTFFVDVETLQSCYPGLKLEAAVKELDFGVKFIDNVETVFPSFYTYLLNERVREWKEPGPPKRWMRGQYAKGLGEAAEDEDHMDMDTRGGDSKDVYVHDHHESDDDEKDDEDEYSDNDEDIFYDVDDGQHNTDRGSK